MKTNQKVLVIVVAITVLLSIATIINVALNFNIMA